MHSPDSQLRRHEAFHSEYLEHDRDVLVWLPPGYTEVPDDGSARGFHTRVPHEGSGTSVGNPRAEPCVGEPP